MKHKTLKANLDKLINEVYRECRKAEYKKSSLLSYMVDYTMLFQKNLEDYEKNLTIK